MSDEITDTDRLDWLERHDANLVSHREQMSEGYSVCWNVAKHNKSVSGHPVGSPRAAIDAAIEQSGEIFHMEINEDNLFEHVFNGNRSVFEEHKASVDAFLNGLTRK